MLKRVYLSLIKNHNNTLRRCCIFSTLFFFFITSLLISTLSDSFKKEFESFYDLYISISYNNPLSIEFPESLEKIDGVIYSDIEYNWDSYNICFAEISNDEVIPYYMESMVLMKKDFNINHSIPSFGEIVIGTTKEEFLYLKFHNNLKISQGRTFDRFELEEGEAVCVVSEGMMSDDKGISYVRPGDYIPITIMYKDDENVVIDFYTKWIKVIGLINDSKITIPTVVLPAKYLDTIRFEAESFLLDCDSNYFDDHAIAKDEIYIESQVLQLDTVDQLRDAANYLDSTWEHDKNLFSYSSTIAKYAPVLSDIEAVSSGFNVICLICLAVSFAIACILILLEIIYSQKEFMVLKALGENSLSIAFQFSLETLIIMLMSSVFSFICAYFAVNVYANSFINSFIFENKYTDNPIYSFDYNIYQYAMKPVNVNLHVSVHIQHILILLAFMMLVVLTTMVSVNAFIRKQEIRKVLRSE